jgi:hypothetical protein
VKSTEALSGAPRQHHELGGSYYRHCLIHTLVCRGHPEIVQKIDPRIPETELRAWACETRTRKCQFGLRI